MDDQDQASFVDRFMADYFAECDEHLAESRAALLVLERSQGAAPPRAILDDLFRNFHSLKGISAIASIREGEQLAHEMESCLRALRSGEVSLTTATVDALADGVRALEEVLHARRGGTDAPSIDGPLARLREVAVPSGPVPAATSPAADPQGRRWRVTFTPSPELVARDIKVDVIRQRLLEIGHIDSVTPRVLDEGRIAFEFIVDTADNATLRKWSVDGVAIEAVVPAAADEPQAPRPLPPAGAVGNFVRVELARLDGLMQNVGELVVTRSRMEDVLQRVERHMPPAEWRALMDHADRLERQLRELREGVMRVRLVPVGEIFRRMPFVVRDLARDTGKRVQIELSGQDTEIDKLLIERMLDPILHLVRNAVSHGIEAPDERTAAGKPPDGTIRLSAAAVGDAVVLEIGDDGRGIDRTAIVARGRAAGLDGADEAATDDRALLDVICAPGFSTRDVADRASGRGVGMAVARDTVEELGGTLEVSSAPQEGTTFRISLPLTLSIADALIVNVGGQTFAVPQGAVREVVEVPVEALTSIEGHELVVHRGQSLPVVRLARVFGTPSSPGSRMHGLIVGQGPAAVGLLVDRIAGHREIVVKTVADPLIKVDGVIGATELGDGRVVLILDAAWVAHQVRQRGARRTPAAREARP